MSDEDTKPLDDEELIPIETLPETPAPVEDADDVDPDDEDDEDERLGSNPEDTEEELSANNKRRKQRRDARKRARERAETELAELRQIAQIVPNMVQKIRELEGHAVTASTGQLEARLAERRQQLDMAEHIVIAATSQGNTEDALQASRIRDSLRSEITVLEGNREQLRTVAEQVRAPAPQQTNPAAVEQHKGDWLRANSWFDPTGGDPASVVARGIDTQLAAEGFNPGERTYWVELTKRTNQALETLGRSNAPADEEQRVKRSGPPVGTTREHAPVGTRKNEIYVTPERKAAMQELGVWDDPQARSKYLKAYRDWDKNQTAR